SALLSTIMNIAAGIAIVLVTGWRWLGEIRPDARAIAVTLLVAAVAALVALPFLLPYLGALAARITGRTFELTAPPRGHVLSAVIGNVVAWVLYGVAFMWQVRGLIGGAPSPLWEYIGVYAASYVVGYLFLFLPGGIGPREAVMIALL